MEIHADGFTPIVVYLYFIFCVIICNFFILNTTVAIMLDKYLELRESKRGIDYHDRTDKLVE